MGYDAAGVDGHPQQPHSQATEGMDLINNESAESDQASASASATAAALDGPTRTSSAEPETVTKNVSFNLQHGNQDVDSDDDSQSDIGGDGDVTSSVRVAVRIRPFLPSETGTSGVIDVLPSSAANNASTGRHKRKRRQEPVPTSLQIGGPAGAQFTYDAVHGTKSTQADLYLDTVRPLVRQCLKGCELHVVVAMCQCIFVVSVCISAQNTHAYMFCFHLIHI